MSAKLPLPKQVFGHGFLLNKGEKMSKSVGNVIDPIALADAFGVDQLRYFLMREVSFGQDGSYTPEAIIRTANADLANSFGNLAQRSLSMIFKNLDGKVSKVSERQPDIDLRSIVTDSCRRLMPREFEKLNFSEGLVEWLRAVFACNQYVDEQAPWTLKKTDPDRMQAVLMTLFVCIHDLAIAIQPVVPDAAAGLLDQMGVPSEERDFAALADPEWFLRLVDSGFLLAQPRPIFPRLEMPETEG